MVDGMMIKRTTTIMINDNANKIGSSRVVIKSQKVITTSDKKAVAQQILFDVRLHLFMWGIRSEDFDPDRSTPGALASQQQLAFPHILIVNITVRARLSIDSCETQLNLSPEKLDFRNYNLFWNPTAFHRLPVFAAPCVDDEKAKITSLRHNSSIKEL